MQTAFLKQTLAEKHFPQTLFFSVSIKHFPTLTYRNPKTTLEKTSSSQVLMRWLLISRQLLCHPVAWIFARNIPHPPTERCVNSTIWRLGENSEVSLHHSIWPFRKFIEQHQLFHCIPLFQPQGSKSQETSSPQHHHCPRTASSKFSTKPRSI